MREGTRSELWQRLRAARLYYFERTGVAMSQRMVAEAVGLNTRAAVGLWESDKDDQRTEPDLEQLEDVADLCGVDLGWLASRKSDPDCPVPAGAKAGVLLRGPNAALTQASAFWRAVREMVIGSRPELSGAFDKKIAHGVTASFHSGSALATVWYFDTSAVDDQDALLRRQAADMLLVEAVLGYRHTKAVAVFTPSGRYSSPTAKALGRCGVEFACFRDIPRAMAFLVSLADENPLAIP